jgi:hypothetical protein
MRPPGHHTDLMHAKAAFAKDRLREAAAVWSSFLL